MFNKLSLIFLIAIYSLQAHAALWDRGNGLIYDDVLDITWMQNANAFDSPGDPLEGSNTWWIIDSQLDGFSYGGYSDWRLPTLADDYDTGFNLTDGELGYMYYVNLGNPSDLDANCFNFPDTCLLNTSFIDAASGQTKQFENVIAWDYWYDYYDPDRGGGLSVKFSMDDGRQFTIHSGDEGHAWLVRDGDVAVVPVPATAWLFSSAILGLLGAARKK